MSVERRREKMTHEHVARYIATAATSVVTALSPTLPYILLCTAAILFDCYTAYRLSKRVKVAHPDKASKDVGKFNSEYFRRVLRTLMESYALLIFAYFVHVYVTANLPFDALKVAAGLIIGWQAWSCLENISSCNGAKWAKTLQQVMVDKTERHFDVDLSSLKDKENDTETGQQQ